MGIWRATHVSNEFDGLCQGAQQSGREGSGPLGGAARHFIESRFDLLQKRRGLAVGDIAGHTVHRWIFGVHLNKILQICIIGLKTLDRNGFSTIQESGHQISG